MSLLKYLPTLAYLVREDIVDLTKLLVDECVEYLHLLESTGFIDNILHVNVVLHEVRLEELHELE